MADEALRGCKAVLSRGRGGQVAAFPDEPPPEVSGKGRVFVLDQMWPGLAGTHPNQYETHCLRVGQGGVTLCSVARLVSSSSVCVCEREREHLHLALVRLLSC